MANWRSHCQKQVHVALLPAAITWTTRDGNTKINRYGLEWQHHACSQVIWHRRTNEDIRGCNLTKYTWQSSASSCSNVQLWVGEHMDFRSFGLFELQKWLRECAMMLSWWQAKRIIWWDSDDRHGWHREYGHSQHKAWWELHLAIRKKTQAGSGFSQSHFEERNIIFWAQTDEINMQTWPVFDELSRTKKKIHDQPCCSIIVHLLSDFHRRPGPWGRHREWHLQRDRCCCWSGRTCWFGHCATYRCGTPWSCAPLVQLEGKSFVRKKIYQCHEKWQKPNASSYHR